MEKHSKHSAMNFSRKAATFEGQNDVRRCQLMHKIDFCFSSNLNGTWSCEQYTCPHRNDIPFGFTRSRRAWCLHNSAKHLRHICAHHKQRNLLEILLNQTQIIFYLPFSDWIGTKLMSVWFQINRKKVNTIWIRVDLLRFRKDFSVCRITSHRAVRNIKPTGNS